MNAQTLVDLGASDAFLEYYMQQRQNHVIDEHIKNLSLSLSLSLSVSVSLCLSLSLSLSLSLTHTHTHSLTFHVFSPDVYLGCNKAKLMYRPTGETSIDCPRQHFCLQLSCMYFFESELIYTAEFGPGGIRTHSLLTFGQTPNPYCLGALQEDSCLPKL